MKNLKYNVIFSPEPEGGFTAMVPTLPGCISYGETLVEAKKMIIDAMEAYIFSLKKHNEFIPQDSESFISSINIDKTPLIAKAEFKHA